MSKVLKMLRGLPPSWLADSLQVRKARVLLPPIPGMFSPGIQAQSRADAWSRPAARASNGPAGCGKVRSMHFRSRCLVVLGAARCRWQDKEIDPPLVSEGKVAHVRDEGGLPPSGEPLANDGRKAPCRPVDLARSFEHVETRHQPFRHPDRIGSPALKPSGREFRLGEPSVMAREKALAAISMSADFSG
jgi:hypothetical protein